MQQKTNVPFVIFGHIIEPVVFSVKASVVLPSPSTFSQLFPLFPNLTVLYQRL